MRRSSSPGASQECHTRVRYRPSRVGPRLPCYRSCLNLFTFQRCLGFCVVFEESIQCHVCASPHLSRHRPTPCKDVRLLESPLLSANQPPPSSSRHPTGGLILEANPPQHAPIPAVMPVTAAGVPKPRKPRPSRARGLRTTTGWYVPRAVEQYPPPSRVLLHASYRHLTYPGCLSTLG
jgi:hypothetical protein